MGPHPTGLSGKGSLPNRSVRPIEEIGGPSEIGGARVRSPGHHLADLDQLHVFSFSWLFHDSSIGRQARWSGCLRTFGFLFDGCRTVSDPHQSPFWIKTLGLPLVGKTPGPWLV